jgi:prevent-host-death family protein
MWSILKTATVRDLRNRYSTLLAWIGAGEEIVITQRGKTVARLVPAQDEAKVRVDWAQSPAVKRDRSKESLPTSAEVAEIIHQAGGKW